MGEDPNVREQPGIPVTPAAAALAEEVNVPLENVTPSGAQGKIVKDDVQTALDQAESQLQRSYKCTFCGYTTTAHEAPDFCAACGSPVEVIAP